MPFQSDAQRRFLYARHPKIAARWSKETPQGRLPRRKKKKKIVAIPPSRKKG